MRLTLTALAALAALGLSVGCEQKTTTKAPVKPVSLTVGHVGHDHHLALFVALDKAAEYSGTSGIAVRTVEDKRRYELYDRGTKLADLDIVKVGGGSKMPTALSSGVIEVGLGGVAAVLAAADKGSPLKMIAPLHSKGDMLVVKKDCPAGSWSEFVQYVKASDKPLRVGYKSPVACAKVIFEEALKHEGLTFGGSQATGVQVHMICVKGGGKLNVSLASGIVDAYVGNNPFPAIGAEKGILKVVADLEELPPGTFREHPCCCVAASTHAIAGKGRAISALLTLMLQANDTINRDLDTAVISAGRWIGTSDGVERMSIPTSGYDLNPDAEWRGRIGQWVACMEGLGILGNRLKEADISRVSDIVFDFSLLENARRRLGGD